MLNISKGSAGVKWHREREGIFHSLITSIYELGIVLVCQSESKYMNLHPFPFKIKRQYESVIRVRSKRPMLMLWRLSR